MCAVSLNINQQQDPLKGRSRPQQHSGPSLGSWNLSRSPYSLADRGKSLSVLITASAPVMCWAPNECVRSALTLRGEPSLSSAGHQSVAVGICGRGLPFFAGTHCWRLLEVPGPLPRTRPARALAFDPTEHLSHARQMFIFALYLRPVSHTPAPTPRSPTPHPGRRPFSGL